MAAVRHDVVDRDAPHGAAVATLDHFSLGPGTAATAALGLEPGWSLYSLELDGPGTAVFVRTAGPLDLGGPFIMNQQRDGAREALVVPMEDVAGLADGLAPPAELAFLFSTGRCGSTLASRIMARLPGVVSLSEPDVYSNLVEARAALGPDEAAGLLRAATVVLCHGLGACRAEHVVIKPRSEAVLHEEVYTAAFPRARHAFMYRDVVGYAQSMTRYARRILGELPRVPTEELLPYWNQLAAHEPLSTLGRVVDLDRTDIGFHEMIPALWALRIDAHLTARERDDTAESIEAFHYEDLVSDRERETRRLLDACGLGQDLTGQVLAVFERDAHEGMAGANDTRVRDLTDDEVAEVLVQLPELGLPTYDVDRL